MAGQAGLLKQVMAAVSAQDTTHTPIFVLPYTNLRLMVKTGAGVSAGSAILEAAPSPTYAGTWVNIAGGIAALGSPDTMFAGGQLVNVSLPYVRAKIGAITGGTVDVWIIAN
jgi:hypothetical protein